MYTYIMICILSLFLLIIYIKIDNIKENFVVSPNWNMDGQVSSDILNTKKYIRVSGKDLASSGTGLELYYDNEVAYINGYDRTNSVFKDLIINDPAVKITKNTGVSIPNLNVNKLNIDDDLKVNKIYSVKGNIDRSLSNKVLELTSGRSGFLCLKWGNGMYLGYFEWTVNVTTPRLFQILNSGGSNNPQPYMVETTPPYITLGIAQGYYEWNVIYLS